MKTFRRSMSFLLAPLLLSGMIFGFQAKAANPPAQNVVPAGNDNYVSAHQYISPTSDPYVFKVTTELALSQKNAITTDVVIHANLGHMYYEDNYNITPVTLPDGTSANKIYQLEKYAAQQLVELLCDPTINANWENTRIGLTATAVNRATNNTDFQNICDAEFFSDLVDTTQKAALLTAIEDYNPSPYRTNTTFSGVRGRGGSNKYADAKGIQRAYQLLTDQPLYFQPTNATIDDTSGYTSATESFAPAWTFIRSDGTTTVAGNAATPMWFENPSVAGESDVKHQKFIIWLGAGLMGGNGDRSLWSNPKKNAASYEMKPSTDPIGTLDLANNVANNPYSSIDTPYHQYSAYTPTWYHYYRAHKWTRYHTQAISTLLEQQSDNNKMRNFQMLALWPTAATSGWPGFDQFRLDFLESITQGPHLPMSPSRPYATHYYNYRTTLTTPFPSNSVDSRAEYYDQFGGTNNWGSWGDLHIIDSLADLEATINNLVAGIVPKITIDGHFSLAEQFSFENIYGGIQVSGGTVVQNGKDISWSLPDVISGTFTMVFYIRMDPDLVEDGSYYPPFDTSYIEYDRNPLSELSETGTASVHVILPFPTTYVSPNGDVQSPSPSPTDTAVIGPADSNASSSSTQDGLIPILGAPINSGVPYTPSVTPNSNQISSEKLEEEVDAIPVTSSPVLTVVIPLGIVALVGISIAYAVKKRRQKH